MRKYMYVLEEEHILSYLQKRQLLKQYKHAKEKLIAGIVGGLDFKERNSQGSGVFSFRINKQFRAIGYERDGVFVVTEIDNHQ